MSIFRRDSDRPQPLSSPEAPARPERPARPAEKPATTTPARSEAKGANQTTRIASSSRIVGEIAGEAELVVDGRVEGEIDLRSRMVVGEKGRVQGKVRAAAVEVAGKVRGNVIGEERVEVLTSGKLEGDVLSPRVVIAEGAFFKGKVEMTDKIPPREGAAAPAASTASATASARTDRAEARKEGTVPGEDSGRGAAKAQGGGDAKADPKTETEDPSGPPKRSGGSPGDRREQGPPGARGRR